MNLNIMTIFPFQSDPWGSSVFHCWIISLGVGSLSPVADPLKVLAEDTSDIWRGFSVPPRQHAQSHFTDGALRWKHWIIKNKCWFCNKECICLNHWKEKKEGESKATYDCALSCTVSMNTIWHKIYSGLVIDTSITSYDCLLSFIRESKDKMPRYLREKAKKRHQKE